MREYFPAVTGEKLGKVRDKPENLEKKSWNICDAKAPVCEGGSRWVSPASELNKHVSLTFARGRGGEMLSD